MARRDEACADAVREAAQRAEFHEVVARDARVGRTAGTVVGHEALDHVPLERFFEIEHVVRDPEQRRARARIVEILRAAAGFGRRRFRGRVHFHRHADDVVALLAQQSRCHGRIDATAHSRDHARLFRPTHAPYRITHKGRKHQARCLK
jgi:hypothetical protein